MDLCYHIARSSRGEVFGCSSQDFTSSHLPVNPSSTHLINLKIIAAVGMQVDVHEESGDWKDVGSGSRNG